MGQPRGECGGFACAGAGQHQHRAFGGEHGFTLGRVQPIKQGIGDNFGHGANI
jgi:hypothetical protein